MDRRKFLQSATAFGAAASVLPLAYSLPANAAGDTIVIALGETITTLDVNRPGTSRASYQVPVNVYDRLVGFGTVKNPDGTISYDYNTIRGEIAESWEVAPNGMSIIFKLRKNAKFHDGTPVTAADVKWSLDRSVLIGGFPPAQMAAGAMHKAEQFVVVDDYTFRIDFPRKSKLSLPDLAVPIPFIVNSKVAKANATEKDPWAMEYLHRNPAGSGAFRVEKWVPGQQLVYVRNDDWKGGPLPKVRRVIIQEVPNQSTRRSLLEHGDVQMAFDIPGKMAKELHEAGKLKVIGQPIANTLFVLIPNLNHEPLNDKNVRQAIAHAIPYEQIFQQVAFGRGERMYGAASPTPSTTAWPQPFPYKTDIDAAKALMAKATQKDGITLTLGFDTGTSWGEPAATLIQEGLAKIGITVNLERIPPGSWRTVALQQKKVALMLDGFGGWLNTPDYYFFFCFRKGLFSAGEYDNPEMNALIQKTIDLDTADPEYAPSIKRMISIAFEDAVRIPLWQPWLESAMQPSVGGYENWFHRGLDARPLTG